MSTVEVEALVFQARLAFDGDIHHSLIANLRGVEARHWRALPQGGGRTIAEIAYHVGWARVAYFAAAFGPAPLRMDDPAITGHQADGPTEALAWLESGYDAWSKAIAATEDAELGRPRLSPFDGPVETRLLAGRLIAHDYYHAGEINHLRALLQGDDRWPWA
jgi:DinB superfamily